MTSQEPHGGEPPRSGNVALVGRSNVGKSTLLNAALELPLAIVSRKPQTTRDRLLGVVRHGPAEIGLLDTPGLHRARTRLGKTMNQLAWDTVRGAAVLVLVVAVPPRPRPPLRPHPQDLRLFEELPPDVPTILVINKIDLLRDKSSLVPLIEELTAARSFAAVVPISARRADGVTRVLDEVAPLLPEGAHQHADDTVTNRPLRFFAAEYVREPILEATAQEVPHAAAVTIDEFLEPVGSGVLRIGATIHVEREGQKRILVGTKGEMLKRVGTRARKRLEELTERQVHLQLWVKVTPHWRDRPAQIDLLAFGEAPLPPELDLDDPPPGESDGAAEAAGGASSEDDEPVAAQPAVASAPEDDES